MTLARFPRGPAERHAVIERAIVADLGRLPDDDAHPVVDEHPPADGRPRMDFDSRQPAGPVREPAGEPAPAPTPEPVRNRAVPDQRMQPRIAGQDLPPGARGRVPVEHDGDVFAKAAEHGWHFRISDWCAQLLGLPRALIKRKQWLQSRRVCRVGAKWLLSADPATRCRRSTMTDSDRLHGPRISPGGTMSRLIRLLVPVAAAASIALARRRAGSHAQGPPLLAADGACRRRRCSCPWCDKIAKESNNRMKCQIYPAMQLGGAPPQLIQQAMDGVADIVWTLPGYTAGRFPMMEVFELPFMSTSAEATSQAAWDYYTQYRLQGIPGHQGARRQRPRQRLRPHRQQAGQGDGRFQGPEDARADAADEQDARRAGRDAGRDAAAGARRRAVQGRRRRLSAAVGGDPVDQGARVHQVRKRNRPEGARALHRGVHPRDEPGEVRQPAAGSQEGDRRELGRGAVEGDGRAVGRLGAARRARSPPIAATRST